MVLRLQQDQFQRLLPTFIQVIDLTEQEEAEYWTVVSAVFEGKEVASIQTSPNVNEKQSSSPSNFPSSVESGINNKVRRLKFVCFLPDFLPQGQPFFLLFISSVFCM